MSRDFLASLVGREFQKSQNRDRVTRAPVSNPFFPVIFLVNSRWGACDWCFTGTRDQIASGSGNRYRKIRITFVTTYGGPGKRIDEITFGDGTQDPVWNLIEESGSLSGGFPDNFTIQADHPLTTATVAYGNYFFLGHATETNGAKIELLDPESDFDDTLITETIETLATLTEFRTLRIDLPPPFGGSEYYDGTYWSKGIVTWSKQLIQGNEVVINNGNIGVNLIQQTPNLTLRGQGFGTYFFNNQGYPHTAGVVLILDNRRPTFTSVQNPPQIAGFVRIGTRDFPANFLWICEASKMLIKRDKANTLYMQYTSQSGVGIEEVDCFPLKTHVNQILLHPPKADVRRGKFVGAFAFPPFETEVSFQYGITPSCFTI